MVAQYTVKVNGKWYKAGEEISPAISEKNSEVTKYSFTKTDINRMSTEDLRRLALKQGIQNADETNGADLKKILIERFGL